MAVGNILDNDLYKFIMHQFIFEKYPDVDVTWSLINRSKSIRIADDVDMSELVTQLDRISAFRFNTFMTEILNTVHPNFFTKQYLDYLVHDFRLAPYSLDVVDGQFELFFRGSWLETTLWEVMAMATISELRGSGFSFVDTMDDFTIKCKMIREYNHLNKRTITVSDFGTRRRVAASFQASVNIVGRDIFSGTSNVWVAWVAEIPCVGTYAHEIPMVLTALANGWDAVDAQYEFPAYCYEKYGSVLILPDTYGSTQFYDNMPSRPGMVNHVPIWAVDTIRIDSKDPVAAGNEALQFMKEYLSEPSRRVGLLFSDGLKVESILYLDAYFKDKAHPKFGWGTDVTNANNSASIVCKVTEVEGRPCIKLSDQFAKATNCPETAEYYRMFGTKGME